MDLLFRADKETKNTIRFAEVVAPDATAKVGMIYIPKGTLAELQYAEGKDLVLSVKTVNYSK